VNFAAHLLARWFSGPGLNEDGRARLHAWRARAEPDLSAPHAELRHVVLDVETSGLNVHSDHLIAIGAVAVVDLRISLADSFHVVLRQAAPSSDANILVHRIGGTAQMEGEDSAESLLCFLDFVGKSPLVGFHAPFDEIMIRRAMRAHLGLSFRRKWLDLAWLAPALLPEVKATGLDDWTGRFGIVNANRHNALADAMATARLFLVLQHQAQGRGLKTVEDLMKNARAREWLGAQKP
jgi:DNA polymerase-3 subunit epsilon